MTPARAVAIACTLCALALATGCASGPTPAPAPQAPPRAAEPTATPSEDTTRYPFADLASIQLDLEPVTRGFEQPLCVTNAGDGSGRLFVLEQTGRVMVVRGGDIVEAPYLDLRRRISAGGERGLLGLAFAPDFKSSGRFYVNYTDPDGDTIVARYTADDPASDAPKLAGPEVLLKIKQPYPNHNGGCLAFSPKHPNLLWIGMGDGGSGGDPEGNGQNPDTLLGKMLVLDVTQTAPKPRIVALGLRNPWRFSFDRSTGDLWIGDVGQQSWEEIDRVPATGGPVSVEGMLAAPVNFGWNVWEGRHAYPPGAKASRDGFVFPVLEYSHDEGESVTGGCVYRGSASPGFRGAYVYADFVKGWIAAAGWRGDGVARRVMLENAGNPASFGEDEAGELYLCDLNGTLYQVVVTAP